MAVNVPKRTRPITICLYKIMNSAWWKGMFVIEPSKLEIFPRTLAFTIITHPKINEMIFRSLNILSSLVISKISFNS